jgi:hypothetical protein
MDVIDALATGFEISMQAAARRIVEETRQDCGLEISFRNGLYGRLMPHHLYCSRSFEQRFRWKGTACAKEATAVSRSENGKTPFPGLFQ